MSDAAITVDGLGKLYRIGVHRVRHDTLRDQIAASVSRRFHRRDRHDEEERLVWALRDVSLEVQPGEVLGLIGRNGAGKSTLLKILSRITDPTEGRATLRGRVGSLLEVGTGFHGELTGRENVYLNGAILGMRHAEIDRKFDEIVAFSEVERYIDTPVKRYSSGMYLRLAFAVAAHLEPEILLVDEVLAVGDAGFQRKCLGKMSDVGHEGRTVVFVSHNMAALSNLCTRAVMLNDGRVVATGETDKVIETYLASMQESGSIPLGDRTDRFGGDRLRITEVSLEDADGHPTDFLQTGRDARIVLHYESPTRESFRNVFVRIYLEDLWGRIISAFETGNVGQNFERIGPSGRFVCTIPRLPFQPSTYPFWVYVNAEGTALDEVRSAGRIRVEDGDYYGTGRNPAVGSFVVDHSWSVEQPAEPRLDVVQSSRAVAP